MQIADVIIKKCLPNVVGVHFDKWTVTFNHVYRSQSISLKIHNRIDFMSYKDVRFCVEFLIDPTNGSLSFRKVNVVCKCIDYTLHRHLLANQIKSQLIGVDDCE